ncbi:hypothetical protein EV356DRAFT_247069 [Viridothelium virens]|uniref:Uncharacterized protein n=1 Tax=Viridothelium virens TaxID=1048519 RepID=A0A6A6H3Q9_VIRVR|nr:hypothetical protein EV356DRAFT_247069 [Viridothelium virens]
MFDQSQYFFASTSGCGFRLETLSNKFPNNFSRTIYSDAIKGCCFQLLSSGIAACVAVSSCDHCSWSPASKISHPEEHFLFVRLNLFSVGVCSCICAAAARILLAVLISTRGTSTQKCLCKMCCSFTLPTQCHLKYLALPLSQFGLILSFPISHQYFSLPFFIE